MARFNEILVGRHNAFVRRVFGIKAGSPAPTVSSEISVSHSIFHGRENRYIEGWYPFGCYAQQAAAVGFNSRFMLRNPASSGVIAVIEQFIFSTSAAGTFDMQYGQGLTADLATLYTTRALDGRVKQASGCKFSSDATVAAGQIGTTIQQITTSTTTSTVLPFTSDAQICLTPGDEFVIQNFTANLIMNCSMMWRERTIDEGERI